MKKPCGSGVKRPFIKVSGTRLSLRDCSQGIPDIEVIILTDFDRRAVNLQKDSTGTCRVLEQIQTSGYVVDSWG